MDLQLNGKRGLVTGGRRESAAPSPDNWPWKGWILSSPLATPPN